MPDHRNGCRAWQQGTTCLTGRGVLAGRGIQGPCSQTLKDAKIQMLSFIIQQLTRNECYKGLAFGLKILVFSDLTFKHVCSIAFHKPSLNSKQNQEKFNCFGKASDSNSTANNWSRAGSKLG